MQRHTHILSFLYLYYIFALLFTDAQEKNRTNLVQSRSLSRGGVDSPSYTSLSPSLQGRIVFRGQTESINGSTLNFHLVPDLLDPANTDKAPFVQGQFIVGRKARVKAFLANDANLSLTA